MKKFDSETALMNFAFLQHT